MSSSTNAGWSRIWRRSSITRSDRLSPTIGAMRSSWALTVVECSSIGAIAAAKILETTRTGQAGGSPVRGTTPTSRRAKLIRPAMISPIAWYGRSYDAEFLEDAGGVFRDITGLISPGAFSRRM